MSVGDRIVEVSWAAASNRKKAQRRPGPDSRKATQGFQAGAATPDQFPGGLGELVQLARSRVEREADALSAWRGDAEPVSAETPAVAREFARRPGSSRARTWARRRTRRAC